MLGRLFSKIVMAVYDEFIFWLSAFMTLVISGFKISYFVDFVKMRKDMKKAYRIGREHGPFETFEELDRTIKTEYPDLDI